MRFPVLLRLEFYKSHRQKLFLIEFALLAFLALYFSWDLRKPGDLTQAWMDVLYTMPLMDAMLFPLSIAAIASRLCEAEHKGNTFKLLETMQTPRSLYAAKLVCGILHLALVCVVQALIVLALGTLYGFGPAPLARFLLFALNSFAAALPILLLQMGLSLTLANQLIPLTVGVIGSFLGFMILLFPQAVQLLLPWGYFGVLSQVGMDYNPATRAVNFYWTQPSPVGIILLGVWVFGLLIAGCELFAHKEV